VTRGCNFRAADRDRYVREVREPICRLTAWLDRSYSSADMRAALARIMAQYPTVGAIPYQPAPATRTGLVPNYLRVTRQQRGMLDLIAALKRTSVSEALRGVLAARMEE